MLHLKFSIFTLLYSSTENTHVDSRKTSGFLCLVGGSDLLVALAAAAVIAVSWIDMSNLMRPLVARIFQESDHARLAKSSRAANEAPSYIPVDQEEPESSGPRSLGSTIEAPMGGEFSHP